MDNELGKFVSVDPALLILHDKEELGKIVKGDINRVLSNPQQLNSYSYAINNPLVMEDENGEFAGPFGRDMASGQRQIASFLHNAGDYTSSQGGFINKTSGFVTNTLGDVANNMANVFDPDQKVDTRVWAFGMVALDASTGGEGKVVKNIGKVTQEVKILDVGKRAIQSLDDIDGFTKHGLEEMRKYGLTLENIKDAVENTTKLTKRADNLGRTSYRYVSEKAVVNFNKFKEFITGWPK